MEIIPPLALLIYPNTETNLLNKQINFIFIKDFLDSKDIPYIPLDSNKLLILQYSNVPYEVQEDLKRILELCGTSKDEGFWYKYIYNPENVEDLLLS